MVIILLEVSVVKPGYKVRRKIGNPQVMEGDGSTKVQNQNANLNAGGAAQAVKSQNDQRPSNNYEAKKPMVNEQPRIPEKSEVVENNEDLKKEDPTAKFARIVFDATDMDKGCQTMRIKADTPMREIKKLFPKHLSATEDTFMLCFNNREVQNETPLQLFGDNLEGDHNVIEIVKTIKIKLAGKHLFDYHIDPRTTTILDIKKMISLHKGEGKEPSDQDTTVNLRMSGTGTDILCASLKFDETIKVHDLSMAENEELSYSDDSFASEGQDDRTDDVNEKIKKSLQREVISKKTENALQMRRNREKRKEKIKDGFCLAKDIQNHKDFENVDDILKFIGEEDSTSKNSKENKDQVESSKRRKRKNKKRITSKESDKKIDTVGTSDIQDSNRVDFVVEVPRGDADSDRGNSTKNNADEDSAAKTTEGNNVNVVGLDVKQQINTNGKETDTKQSNNNVKSVADSLMDSLQDEVQRSKGDKQSEMKGEKQKSFSITEIGNLKSNLAIFESKAETLKKEIAYMECAIGEYKRNLPIMESMAETQKKKGLEKMECLIGNFKSNISKYQSGVETKREDLREMESEIGKLMSKLAVLGSEAKAKDLEEYRMHVSDDKKYHIQEIHECQNANTLHEEIETMRALVNKLESIQEEGVANHVLGSNVENEHEVMEVKKDCGENGQYGINEVTRDRKKHKKEKPYCARALCLNKGGHKCSRCKAVFYCHQDCLNEDWPLHKVHCDYVYEANKLPHDETTKNTSEIENTDTREEVD